MDIELFIHGVPKGQQFWGKDDDIAYINNFYCIKEDNIGTNFLIEMRSVKSKNYCYYSYLKYKNVVASDGRSGAYFGISLRIDQYCVNAIGMYHLLNIIYNRYIINFLLTEETTQIKFIVPNFEVKNAEIKNIEKALIELIPLSFSPSDFQNISSLKITPSNSTPLLSLYDCSKENINSAIEKHFKVSISSDYPTSRERRQEQEMAQMQTSFVNSKEKEINELSGILEEERKKSNQLSKENDNLRQRLDRLEKECKENERRKTVEQLISEIKEPLRSIQKPLIKLSIFANTPVSTGFNSTTKVDEGETNQYSQSYLDWNLSKYIRIVILLIVILLIQVVQGYFTYSFNKNHEDFIKPKQTIQTFPTNQRNIEKDSNLVIGKTIKMITPYSTINYIKREITNIKCKKSTIKKLLSQKAIEKLI